MSRKRITIHDLQEAKRNKIQLAETFTMCPMEAAACEAAGIDIIVTMGPATKGSQAKAIREAAPNVFLVMADDIRDPNIANESQAISAAFRLMEAGADAVYTSLSCKIIAAMAREKIPVIGHVGYVPYNVSWFGKPRAVGKKGLEAYEIYEQTMAHEDAGAIGVEIEIVPAKVTAEIAKRTEILLVSMGAGTGGDVQYLFACDMLGTNTGHIPRHAKVYANLHKELERVQQMRIDAFKAFKDDVTSGAYPEEKHLLSIKDEEYDLFLKQLSK